MNVHVCEFQLVKETNPRNARVTTYGAASEIQGRWGGGRWDLLETNPPPPSSTTASSGTIRGEASCLLTYAMLSHKSRTDVKCQGNRWKEKTGERGDPEKTRREEVSSGTRRTQHDENTARQFKSLRLEAMAHLTRVAESPLLTPRFSVPNAGEKVRPLDPTELMSAEVEIGLESRRGCNEMSTEQRRNARAGETGYPRENPPISGIFRKGSHLRSSGSDSAGNRTRIALLEQASIFCSRFLHTFGT
ncbi:hypothetical protein PR048_019011 [Dryococelus australis]|uniref:Uncharacterized protein n=1 Tax=Dryococelus australis TaxID=614101 RepID=A0ABQ9H2C4_9NEOP|nr:hypothetical protein PR048_019011 [Dryococelus australis]